MNKSLDDAKRTVIRPPKGAALLTRFLMVYPIWSYHSSANRTEKYQSDCRSLFAGRPTNACYETDAVATYQEDRKANGGI
jgi:hypothetical protein